MVEGRQGWHLASLAVLVSIGGMTDEAAATQTLTDIMDPARARALQATLGREATADRGTPLPPFFHHIYFWDPQPPENLGRDGHPALGGFVPDMGLPRRMWAAGRLLFHAPLLAGVQAEKTSAIEGVTRKSGRSGPLAFVSIRHDIRQRGTVVLSEWQDLVYREDGGAAPKRPKARTDEDHVEQAQFDSTTLFRYSALTFNGHKIHYDRPYARRVEGYDNLVVHGPLLAQHLILMGEARLGKPLTEVTYRATAPHTLPKPVSLCWKDGTAWVRGPDGAQCMEAQMR
jgi:3-methylfumaryl-CoA hydratase